MDNVLGSRECCWVMQACIHEIICIYAIMVVLFTDPHGGDVAHISTRDGVRTSFNGSLTNHDGETFHQCGMQGRHIWGDHEFESSVDYLQVWSGDWNLWCRILWYRILRRGVIRTFNWYLTVTYGLANLARSCASLKGVTSKSGYLFLVMLSSI